MAGPAYVKIRLWNPGRDHIFGDTENVLNYCERPVYGTGLKPRYFEVKWIGATQAAAEELGTAANSAKDGTTTPFQITVVSAEVNDTDAATGDARKVALIGVTVSSIGAFNAGEKPILSVEVVALNGTTDVLSTRYYLHLIHAYCCDWGSGGQDAKGDITIESPADTDLQTIVATYNESNGGTLYFAEGDMVYLDRIFCTSADASVAATDGILLTITPKYFEDSLNGDPDVDTFYYMNLLYAPFMFLDRIWLSPMRATNQSTLLLAETLVGNSQTFMLQFGIKIENRL